jgi:hypothetical protein
MGLARVLRHLLFGLNCSLTSDEAHVHTPIRYDTSGTSEWFGSSRGVMTHP